MVAMWVNIGVVVIVVYLAYRTAALAEACWRSGEMPKWAVFFVAPLQVAISQRWVLLVLLAVVGMRLFRVLFLEAKWHGGDGDGSFVDFLKTCGLAVFGLLLLRLLCSRWVKLFIMQGPTLTFKVWREWRRMPKEVRKGDLADLARYWRKQR